MNNKVLDYETKLKRSKGLERQLKFSGKIIGLTAILMMGIGLIGEKVCQTSARKYYTTGQTLIFQPNSSGFNEVRELSSRAIYYGSIAFVSAAGFYFGAKRLGQCREADIKEGLY